MFSYRFLPDTMVSLAADPDVLSLLFPSEFHRLLLRPAEDLQKVSHLSVLFSQTQPYKSPENPSVPDFFQYSLDFPDIQKQ